MASAAGKDCGVCGKPCTANFVMIKENAIHADCFSCGTCSVGLAGKPFIQAAQDSKFYCQDHYYEKYNPKCGHCEEVIKGQYITAMNKHWHEHHFVCSECGSEFSGNQFHRYNDRPYCKEHYLRLASPHCAKCKKPIVGDIFEALEQKFHADCFVCSSGDHKLEDGATFHLIADKVFCKAHFESQFLLSCNVCSKPLEGEYIKLGDVQIHPACWACAKCSKNITPTTAQQVDGTFYCDGCIGGAKASHSSGGGGADRLASDFSGARIGDGATSSYPVSSTGAKDSKGGPGAKADGKREEIKIEVFYTYDVLKKKDDLPDAVAKMLHRKEDFLSPGDFQKVFNCTRETFLKYPKWKQTEAKKRVGLF